MLLLLDYIFRRIQIYCNWNFCNSTLFITAIFSISSSNNTHFWTSQAKTNYKNEWNKVCNKIQ
jgi:hypothetical protein